MKTIDWTQVSGSDSLAIRRITRRAVKVLSAEGVDADPIATEMDLMATHISCPLDLDKLESFDEFNFAHDIFGIRRHLDRETGELRGHFQPKCAK